MLLVRCPVQFAEQLNPWRAVWVARVNKNGCAHHELTTSTIITEWPAAKRYIDCSMKQDVAKIWVLCHAYGEVVC